MTVNDARKIIAVMLVSYPNFKPIDTELMATTWADMLNEYSYEQVSVALKCYITTDTSGFAPSIGQLIDKLKTVEPFLKEHRHTQQMFVVLIHIQ